jgi:hypothetical protein
MLEVYAHNLLSMKSFHGVLAGNVYQCLLKTNIGKVRLLSQLFGSRFLQLKAYSCGCSRQS